MRNVYLCCIIVLSICALGMQGTINTQQDAVIVPNVEGITLEVAAKILQTAGLQPRFPASLNTSTIVAQQHPRPGVELPMGGEVVLFSDTTPRAASDIPGTRSQGQTPSVSSRLKVSTGAVSTPSGTSAVTSSHRAANVSVSPSQTNWQTSEVLAYPASALGGKSTIFYQPPQRAISHYFVAESKPRFYPAWYPKRFFTVVSPQGSASTAQSENMRITVQPQVQPQVVDQTEAQSYLAWYPNVLVSQESSRDSTVLSQSDRQQRVGVFEVSAMSAVPVPNLFRLRQEDADAAIKKAGLTAGTISGVQSSQARPGLVVQQSPRARAIVPAGTPVHLWVAE